MSCLHDLEQKCVIFKYYNLYYTVQYQQSTNITYTRLPVWTLVMLRSIITNIKIILYKNESYKLNNNKVQNVTFKLCSY